MFRWTTRVGNVGRIVSEGDGNRRSDTAAGRDGKGVILIASVWTDDLSQSTRFWICIPLLVLIFAGYIYRMVAEKKRAERRMLETLTWALKAGFNIKFAEPPKGVSQVPDAALKTIKDLNCPFIGVSIYDHGSSTSDVIWLPSQPDMFLVRGCRIIGRGNWIRESWMIGKIDAKLPTGYCSLLRLRYRSENFEWKLTSNDPKGTWWRAPEPEVFRSLLTSEFVAVLRSKGCLGFQSQGNFIELFFDGEVSSKTWNELYPKVTEIIERLRLYIEP